MIEFLWSALLPLLLLLPVLIAVYVWALRRRKKFALRYSSLALIRPAAGRGPSIRRHIPPAIFLFAIAAMMLALARPYSVVTLPSIEGTVILAIDVSGSMRADDLKPSRIEAAKAAARTFVDRQADTTRIGVVAFSGNSALVQTPTTDKSAVDAAIRRLVLGPRTAIGSAIITSLDAIAAETDDSPAPRPTTVGPRGSTSTAIPLPTPTALPVGIHIPAIIVLLTDGQNNSGIAPIEAAQAAVDRGVRVFTIGVGSTEGTVTNFGGGRGFRTQLDEASLKQIAKMTDARYYRASTETDLHDIYENLNTREILRTQRTEVTFLFTTVAAALLVLSGTLSMLWLGRLP